MNLFKKILCVGIVGLLVATVIASISIVSGNYQRSLQDEEARYTAFRGEVSKAITAHLLWLRNIDTAIIDSKPEINIVIDGKLCAFGKWYYDQGQEITKTLPETFQQAYRDIESGHNLVHERGGELQKTWNPEEPEPGKKYFMEEIAPVATTLIGKLQDMEKLADDAIADVGRRGEFILKYQSLPVIVTLILGVVILLPFSFWIARDVVKAMQTGVGILKGIAEKGAIDNDVPDSLLKRKDEIGVFAKGIEEILIDYRSIAELFRQLAGNNWNHKVRVKSDRDNLNANLNHMLDQVNNVLSEINVNVQKVATGAGEVSAASMTLSNGAQESAASLEEITASMSEISGQTKTNAESANEARDLAQKATEAASAGQTAMQSMNEAMERITQNSGDIQKVIKVIDDIAFQTNLLALNAAVEAARAGVHGKGFAVVAEEVRNLAGRSAKAAQETTELISKSGQEIEKGDEIAGHTADVLNSIAEQIKQTTDLVAGIAVASNEQAQGVAQVTIGLQQIDTVTQQNTAAAEESASAAGEMSGMANDLQNLVARFKLRS